MNDLRSMTLEELRELMKARGEAAFRADQLFGWLHREKVKSLEAMSNLPKSLRQSLAEDFDIGSLTLHTRQISRDGTRKYLFLLPDDQAVETVLMQYDYGNTVCVSSQVGCRMGCRFCASTIGGLARNLSAGEMLEQIYRVEEEAGVTVGHVVIMGSGEPLDNMENVIRFIRLLSHPKGKNISERNITLSTCGLAPQIYELAKEKLNVTLALSLHAPDDALRRTMMPVAERYSVKETLAACDAYFKATGRRVSYEYSLVRSVNDLPEHAEALSALLKGKNCHVNLIPVNPVKESKFSSSQAQTVRRFQKILEKNGINATIRKRMGADIDGACGQLRRRLME